MTQLNHISRYREVANVMIKHGFGFLFDKVSLRYIFGFWNTKQMREDKANRFTRPQRLRMALEELGPTYVKLGQLLSIRPDLLSAEYIFELEKLQNSVPPFAFSEVLKVIGDSGLEINRDFKSFNEIPIAAASIAQVHEAVLNDGQHVVVKVQRPGIDKLVATDLEILMDLSGLLEKHTAWGEFYHITEVIDELAEAIRSELDFLQEGRNADLFRKNFRYDRSIKVPKIFWQHSSQRVLIMEYVEGIKISNFSALRQANLETKTIAQKLVNALFKQIFEYGFFHADPHPGNLAISTEQELVFYDFGQMGMVDEVLKEKCVDLLISMMRYDVNGVTRALLDIAIGSQSVNREELRQDVARLEQKYYGLPMSQIKLGESLAELLELSVRYQVRVPPELSLMVKMLMTIESLVMQLDPQLSIVDIAEPYGRKVMLKRYSPKNVSSSAIEIALDYGRIFKQFPHDFENILRQMQEGEFSVNLQHKNINRITARLDIMSNRLSVAIIVASIIIGSALILDKSKSGFINQVPLVEIGFITAVILGLFLTYSILKSGKY
ncbi:ABC1 kinase family protein [Syntrophomonas zehnderi]|uniref:ABC1 kinase family protein n=1 Tax=Syntrophomonas zehnderi TaxID=404335 RepID=UPI001FA7A1FC|nr:AarF/ABC1/UbiB kinase family protein [Syntrophomonas zehnderi]